MRERAMEVKEMVLTDMREGRSWKNVLSMGRS